jgi:hypothetical protein
MPKFSLDRRQFAIGAAAAVTGLVLPGNALSANVLETSAPAQAGADLSLDAKTQAAMAKLTPAAQKEVEMKVASIFRKYGDHLSDEQKSDIRRIMAESQEGLEKMRTFKLENGDQPADTFAAFPLDAKSTQSKSSQTQSSHAQPREAKPREGKK